MKYRQGMDKMLIERVGAEKAKAPRQNAIQPPQTHRGLMPLKLHSHCLCTKPTNELGLSLLPALLCYVATDLSSIDGKKKLNSTSFCFLNRLKPFIVHNIVKIE